MILKSIAKTLLTFYSVGALRFHFTKRRPSDCAYSRSRYLIHHLTKLEVRNCFLSKSPFNIQKVIGQLTTPRNSPSFLAVPAQPEHQCSTLQAFIPTFEISKSSHAVSASSDIQSRPGQIQLQERRQLLLF